MPPRYPTYPVYSAGQWPQQLYQYPATYGWGYPQYPQYPQYGGVPVVGNPYQHYPVSPRRGHRPSVTPPIEIQLHELFGGYPRPTAIWDITQDIHAVRHHHGRGSIDKVSEALLAKPATEPPVKRMRIVSDLFPWDIVIGVGRNEVVTVKQVFGAIHAVMQDPLEKDDWDGETPNGKKHLHKVRCARLSMNPASFKIDSHIKKIDMVGDKTYFLGLKAIGPPEEPEEWLLKLGLPPKQGRR